MAAVTAEEIRVLELLLGSEQTIDDTWVGNELSFWDWLVHPQGGQCIAYKDLGGGVYVATKRLVFHYTMVIGLVGNRDTYEDRYCFQTLELADHALKTWDGTGDPVGWHRHPNSGRRRPDGDPAKEYIEW